ncbi:DNA primase TraC [compost metagenome]
MPVLDADGKQWSLQTITADGSQHFAKDSRMNGCFHAVGGMAALARAPALVIGESYASAGSLAQTLGFATVAALDAGNLPAVAQALHAKYPDKPVIIAGDDDRHLELTQGSNPGKTKAREAAKLTGGTVLLPIFGPGENNYPEGLEAITPQAWRAHQRSGNALSAQQLAALERMQGKTDFNDLARTSMLGQDGMERQVGCVVRGLIDKHQLQARQQRAQRHAPPAHARRPGPG